MEVVQLKLGFSYRCELPPKHDMIRINHGQCLVGCAVMGVRLCVYSVRAPTFIEARFAGLVSVRRSEVLQGPCCSWKSDRVKTSCGVAPWECVRPSTCLLCVSRRK